MINFDKNQLFALFPNIERENQDLFAHLVGVIAENIHLFAACEQQYPVLYNGINYGCISAIVLRARSCTTSPPLCKGRGTALGGGRVENSFPLIQAELMSKNRGCVIIARPEDVKIYKIQRKQNIE